MSAAHCTLSSRDIIAVEIEMLRFFDACCSVV